MSWLSAIFGLILLTLVAILAHRPHWDSVAQDLAHKTNDTKLDQRRIDEAAKATLKVDSMLHEYFFNEMKNTDERVGKKILESALEQVVNCIEEFYAEFLLSQVFQDCMEHVSSIHLNRMKNQNKIEKAGKSGASRLKIWL